MSTKLAHFLRQIPQSNQDAQSIEQLAGDLNHDLLKGYTLLLQTLGMVVIRDDGRIQASSQTAKYMLTSLASFVEADVRLIDDWQTRGIYKDGTSPFQNAASFLYVMEQRRLSLLTDAPPSRRQYVAQVLIKRTNRITSQPEILMQYDESAGQFQLIGGRRKDADELPYATIQREIEEELMDDLVVDQDYNLVCLLENLVPPLSLSPTFGALTEYHFWIFHMVDLKQPLRLQPGDQWVPVDDVLSGRVETPDGYVIESSASEIYELIDQHLPDGLLNLADSFRRN